LGPAGQRSIGSSWVNIEGGREREKGANYLNKTRKRREKRAYIYIYLYIYIYIVSSRTRKHEQKREDSHVGCGPTPKSRHDKMPLKC
jgi:hypothetical protein